MGVLCVPGEGAPVCSPIWYDYEPGGDIHVILDPRSRKGRLLQDGLPVTFVVQEESPPYKYVTVEGTASLEGREDRGASPAAWPAATSARTTGNAYADSSPG